MRDEEESSLPQFLVYGKRPNPKPSSSLIPHPSSLIPSLLRLFFLGSLAFELELGRFLTGGAQTDFQIDEYAFGQALQDFRIERGDFLTTAIRFVAFIFKLQLLQFYAIDKQRRVVEPELPAVDF